MGKSARNYGIDLLRVLSIFLVVILHILGHGGVLATTASYGHFSAAWFLEILAYPAVNCFVLISGFVGYRGERTTPKLQNLLSIFFTVLFYSVGMCLLVRLLHPAAVTLQDIKEAFLPLIKGQYWFYSSYLGVFLLSPILNLFVYSASAKQLYIAALVVAFFSFCSLETEVFTLNYGYSVIWFAFLYLTGAILKKQNIPEKVSGMFGFLTVLGAFLLTWLPQVLFSLTEQPFLRAHAGYFISYTSPTVLAMAIGWLCLFSKLPCRGAWATVIGFFSTSAFSVYLIHDNRHIRGQFMLDTFQFANEHSVPLLVLIVLGSAVAVVLGCTLIDKVRILLFRAVKIDALCQWSERIVKTALNKLYCRLG